VSERAYDAQSFSAINSRGAGTRTPPPVNIARGRAVYGNRLNPAHPFVVFTPYLLLFPVGSESARKDIARSRLDRWIQYTGQIVLNQSHNVQPSFPILLNLCEIGTSLKKKRQKKKIYFY